MEPGGGASLASPSSQIPLAESDQISRRNVWSIDLTASICADMGGWLV